MPTYDYRCDRGHVTEARQGFDTKSIPCPCGHVASRLSVYRDQFINCETGPKGGLKNPTPRDEIRLGQDVSEFEEAAGEVDYAYSKHPEVKQPNYFKEGLKQARKRGAKV